MVKSESAIRRELRNARLKAIKDFDKGKSKELVKVRVTPPPTKKAVKRAYKSQIDASVVSDVGSVITIRRRQIKVVERTSCASCLVNKDQSFASLCYRDTCDASRRPDKTDVMYVLLED